MIFRVPVIAVFTKFDQFRRDVRMRLEDEAYDSGTHLNTEVESHEGHDPGTHSNTEVENVFVQNYLAPLSGPPPFVRLEGECFFSWFTPTLISVL